PMDWNNALFAGLMTSGEAHLRKEIEMVNATDTDLNLGDFDWTVEFWYKPLQATKGEGVVFEIGEGPLREQNKTTSLSITSDGSAFIWRNDASGNQTILESKRDYLRGPSKNWHHFAFTYDAVA